MRQPAWKQARAREVEARKTAPAIGAHEMSAIASNLGDRPTPDEKAAYLDGLQARGIITEAGRAQCKRAFGL